MQLLEGVVYNQWLYIIARGNCDTMQSGDISRFSPWGLFAEHTAWTLFLAGIPSLLLAINWPVDSLWGRVVGFTAWTALLAAPFTVPAFGAVICDWLIALRRVEAKRPGTIEASEGRLPVRISFYEAGYAYLAAAVISGLLIGWMCPIGLLEIGLFLVDCRNAAFWSFVVALVPALLVSLRRSIAARWRIRSGRRA